MKTPKTLSIPKIATPAAPDADHLAIYAKSDNKLYTQTSAGVETQVGTAATFQTITDGELLARLNLAIMS